MLKGSIAKTHEEFLIDLKERRPILFENLEILSKYNRDGESILVKNKYGSCQVLPTNLLMGKIPSIRSAIDKNDYFKNQLLEVHPTFFEEHKIVSDYIAAKNHILIQNKYGLCEVRPNSLLKGHLPSIESAVNKNEYFSNKAKEVHGDIYDYSLVNYINDKTKVKIVSPYQIFEMTPGNHLSGHGCSILSKQSNYQYTTYVEKGLRSKRCINFKVYIIKCWNENEIFYKIGKNFTTIKQRYRCELEMPYQYKIMKEIIFDKTFEQGYKCCELENKLQLDNKQYKYTPKIKFKGSKNECFTELPNLSIQRELI